MGGMDLDIYSHAIYFIGSSNVYVYEIMGGHDTNNYEIGNLKKIGRQIY